MAVVAVNRVRDIVRIELEGRLGGEHHHDDAAVGIIDPGGRSQLSRHAVDHHIGIEAGRPLQHGEAVAQRRRLGEVERRAVDAADLVSEKIGGVAVGIEGDDFIVDGSRPLALEVEIEMIGEVEHCGLVGDAAVIDHEGVVAPHRIGDGDGNIAGQASCAIGILMVSPRLGSRPSCIAASHTRF